MAYNEFAYFYDELNSEADYDALYRYVTDELAAHGIHDGILADLGCGTGDLTLMLAQAGYDVIGIDRSEEMLSVLREKADELDMTGRILLLRQDLLSLDLYGTIRAAVSTFDTYNHIGPADRSTAVWCRTRYTANPARSICCWRAAKLPPLAKIWTPPLTPRCSTRRACRYFPGLWTPTPTSA